MSDRESSLIPKELLAAHDTEEGGKYLEETGLLSAFEKNARGKDKVAWVMLHTTSSYAGPMTDWYIMRETADRKEAESRCEKFADSPAQQFVDKALQEINAAEEKRRPFPNPAINLVLFWRIGRRVHAFILDCAIAPANLPPKARH